MNKVYSKIILLLGLFFIYLTTSSQIILERQVIGSTGNFSQGSTMTISSTVGEVAVQSLFSVNQILTQGFQQPSINQDSLVTYEVINESCNGAANGSIFINNVLGCPGPYSLIVKSFPDTSNTFASDALAQGKYIVRITGSNGCFITKIIDVGLESTEDCKLKFYSGITPNGDGNNDVWYVDNIEQFPINEIKIYNRWGNVVWEGSGYNNDDVVWSGQNNAGNDLPDGTYFYIADVDGEVYKGWVEITR